MRYLWHHLYAILDTYRNELPLHHFLKSYYRNQPKLGSRDRRALSDAVYAWYRCGKALGNDIHTREEQILAALFLCGLRPKAFGNLFPEAWAPLWESTLHARMEQLKTDGYAVALEQLFPYPDLQFSQAIMRTEWLESITGQPRLFLRIRKNADKIERVLKQAGIPFEWITTTCLALPNGTAIDQLILPDAYVVQDASSQATGAFFKPAANEQWWDCCSGAGGKSLLLKDLLPTVRLLATDVRESILRNLKQRFLSYDYPAPVTAVLDAADEEAVRAKMGPRLFDGIICDVPCTGSGTWARTPESLYFFDPEILSTYTERGTAILRHAADYLKPDGKLVYITCSVFRAENEAVVEKVAVEKGLRIEQVQLINGIARQADCLFVAVLMREGRA